MLEGFKAHLTINGMIHRLHAIMQQSQQKGKKYHAAHAHMLTVNITGSGSPFMTKLIFHHPYSSCNCLDSALKIDVGKKKNKKNKNNKKKKGRE